MPSSYTSGQPSRPCRHLTCWASLQRSYTFSSTPCHGDWTSAPFNAHLSIEWECTGSQIETPILYPLLNNSSVQLTTITEVKRNGERLECTTRLCTFILTHPPRMTLPRTACSSAAIMRPWPSRKQTCSDFHWCFIPIFNCSEINGRNNRTYIRCLTPWTNYLAAPLTEWVQLIRLRTGVGRSCSCLHKWLMATSAACECNRVRSNRWPRCLPMSNPSNSPWISQPDLDDETVDWLLNTALRSNGAKQWTERPGSNDDDEAACACVL